jgi:mannan endo-1,4-beta-mannosidase
MNAVRATSSVLLLLAVSAAGQQQAWGQCGGIGYSGASSCVDGYFCTSYNPYYYQCYPGTSVGAVSSTTTSSPTTITTTTTTVKVTTTTTTTTTTTPKATTTSARTTASTATSVSHTTTSSSPSGTAGSSFAKTNGLFFDIDGVTQYYAGTNCYWCGFLTANGDVDHVLSDIAASGLKILRVWGFNDVTTIPSSGTVWYQYLSASGSQINTGADGLQRLDYVVQAAEANDLKLIINFVNNWSDYGGMAAYVTAFGGNTSTWYTNAAAQAQYQAYIKAVVSRYKTSTAVFAWELANEPRCSGCDV